MKPPKFTYHAPRSVQEALDLLAERGPEAKVLAGGQSLVPVLAMRLATPENIIDINRLEPELGEVRVDAGGVTIGALVRHARLEHDDEAAARVPLLRQALGHVAHPTIRNRGTTVGSLVHADPAAEMPAVLTLLGGTVTARSAEGERTLDAAEFFAGPMESSLREDELAVSAHFPAPQGRFGTYFDELARRRGDYAMAGVAAVAVLDEADAFTSLQVSLVSVTDVPQVLDLTELVAGARWEDVDAAALGEHVRDTVETEGDLHASADYRRHLAGVLTRRAARQSAMRAKERAA